MAKSLRSKRRRKMRAEKRIVNAKKELVKLKVVAARLHGTSTNNANITKESIETSFPDVNVTTEFPMQVDDSASGAAPTKRQKLQINNQWMNQKKIRAIKSKIKKHNKKKARKPQSAGLSSKKAMKAVKGGGSKKK